MALSQSAILVVFVSCVLILSKIEARLVFSVVVPRVVRFHIDTVVIVTAKGVTKPTPLYLDLTDDNDVIWSTELTLSKNDVIYTATFKLDPEKVKAQNSELSLSARTGNSQETSMLKLDKSAGYLLIQTDKPIYTPTQTVKYRVVALDDDLRWAPWKVRIDLICPDRIVVDRTIYSSKDSFTGKTFKLPKEATIGQWNITASFITYTQHKVKIVHAKKTLKEGVLYNVTLNKIAVFSRERFELPLTVRFSYELLLFNQSGYDPDDKLVHYIEHVIKLKATDVIKMMVPMFTLKELETDKEKLEIKILKILELDMYNFCCNISSCTTERKCNESDVFAVYVAVKDVAILKAMIPTSVLNRMNITKVRKPVVKDKIKEEKPESITKITVGYTVSSTFEVKEYVLPTFSSTLEISTRVILRTTESFTVKVHARYLHEVGISGVALIKLGVMEGETRVKVFRQRYFTQIDKGYGEVTVNVTDLKTSSLWFPMSFTRLYVEANITDDTNMETTTVTNQSAVFADKVFKFLRIHKPFYIPGQNYQFHTKLLFANDDAVEGIHVKIELRSDDRGIIGHKLSAKTSDHGDIKKTLPTKFLQTICFEIMVTKEEDDFGEEIHEFFQICQPRDEKCEEKLSLQILKPQKKHYIVKITHPFHTECSKLHILIETKGKILFIQSYSMMFKTELNVSIPRHLLQELSPFAFVTGFCLLEDRRTVAVDYVKLDVPDVCHQELKLKVYNSDTTKKPGSDVRIGIEGAAGMLVGLLAVDKGVYVLDNQKSLTRKSLFKTLSKYNLGEDDEESTTDFKDIFNKAGFALLTNIDKIHLVTATPRFISVLDNRHPEIPFKGEDVMRSIQFNPVNSFVWNKPIVHWPVEDDFETVELPPPRKYFPESWLFREEILSHKMKNITVTLPDSITTWVMEAVGVSSNRGVCVAPPIQLVTFKPFFVHLQLPYKVIRLEKVKIRVGIFNHQKMPLSVTVNIYADETVCIVHHPGSHRLHLNIDLEPNENSGKDFSIIPLKTGRFKLRVVARAQSLTDMYDVLERNLFVVAEGNPVKKTLSFPLDPNGKHVHGASPGTIVMKGSTIRNSWDLEKNEQKTLVDLALPTEVIPGTERCDIFAYGDLMADVISAMLYGSVDLMGTSVSDGEEVLGNLAPVIHAIKYIKVVNLKTKEVEEKGHNFVRNSIARLLRYRNSDGSFSCVQQSNPSIWFTAAVLKTMCRARDVIHVDEELIGKGFQWIEQNFKEDMLTMEEEADFDSDVKDSVPNMAAEVLIAIMECGLEASEDYWLLNAMLLFYIEDVFPDVADVVVLAKMAYALYLTESPDLPDILNILNNNKKVTAEGLVFWSDEDDMDKELSKPYWYQTGPSDATVEATAYGLLVFLEQTVTRFRVDPVAEWLIRHRGSNGGFVGALDTTTATQALAAYSVHRQHLHPDLQCNISTHHSSKYHSSLYFNYNNVIHRKSLTNIPTGEDYKFISRGTGLGEVQIKASYNIPAGSNIDCHYNMTVTRSDIKLDINSNIENRKHPLCKYCGFGCGYNSSTSSEPDTSSVHGNSRRVNFSHSSFCVQICVRRVGTKPSRGVTVEAAMLSGYTPLHIPAEQMRVMTGDRVKSHRYDPVSERLITHLNSVPRNESVCFGFLIRDKNIVTRHFPAVVTLTEHGQKEPSCSVVYEAGGPLSLLYLCKQQSKSTHKECICTRGTCGRCGFKRRSLSLRYLIDKVCNADYVYQIKYHSKRKMEEFENWKVFEAEILSVNKSRYTKVEAGHNITLQVPGHCVNSCFNHLNHPHYIIGKDTPRTRNAEGEVVFGYVIDDTTFLGTINRHHDNYIRKSFLRRALDLKRCPR